MKAYQMKEVMTMLAANQAECAKDLSKYVPFGIEMFNEDQLDMFDAEMEKFYAQIRPKACNPICYLLQFENGKETTIIRCKYRDLVEGGIATIFIREDIEHSIGTIELINGELIVNDSEDNHLELVRDNLSDLLKYSQQMK